MATIGAPIADAGRLTGLGKDGVKGLLAVGRSGGQTIAEDQASSMELRDGGMASDAIAMQSAQSVTPLAQIARTLCRRAEHGRGDGKW
jgi:two-component system chemotaxis response regulator CheB